MAKSVAVLKGTLLIIDGRLYGDDLTPDEAAEVILSLDGMPGAPERVYIDLPGVRRRKKSQVGWPK